MSAAVTARSGSKTLIKPRDRPKSNSQTVLGKKGKKDDDLTDQLSSSASLSATQNLLDSLDCPKRVIADDEIYALKITEESLQQLRDQNKQPKQLPAKSVLVKSAKPSLYPPDAKLQRVTVAVPVPESAPLHQRDYTAAAGARMDCYGNIIPHSILGNLDEFISQAKCQQHLPPNYEQNVAPPRSDSQLSVKYDEKKKKEGREFYRWYGGNADDKALMNWEKRMSERRCQQEYLSRLLDKPIEALAMNQGDGLRKVNELRNLIDRAMPYVDYGKGYRAGSEFWTLQPNMGGDECGLFATLTRSEKGCPLPIEHTGVPRCMLYEKGLRFESNSGVGTETIHKPWHQSDYLRHRVIRLAPLMDELDPFVPETSELEVVGQALMFCPSCGQARVNSCQCQAPHSGEGPTSDDDNADKSGDIGNENYKASQQEGIGEASEQIPAAAVYGPSIVFAGQSLKWTGGAAPYSDQVAAAEARVGFETELCERKSSTICITNDGTTAIYYSWKKLCKFDPFDRPDYRIQRFYFDPVGGVILPGDTARFTFIYRSPTHGIYTEQWQLMTHPVVCCGAPLLVTLRGVTSGTDDCSEERILIERLLATREANQIARYALDHILERVHPLPRPRSPPNAYLTEEEMFNQRNPKLEYMEESCSRLKSLHACTVPEELTESVVWDLRPQSIHKDVMIYCTDEMIRDDFLERLNDAVLAVSFRRIKPEYHALYNVCYQLIGCTIDRIFDESERLKTHLTSTFTLKTDSKQSDDVATMASASAGSLADGDASNTHSKDGSTTSITKRGGKVRKESLKRAKEIKTGKGAGKGNKTATAVSESTEVAATSNQSPAQPITAKSTVLTEQQREDYHNRFSAQVYALLCEMAEDIENAFADVLDLKQDTWPQCEEDFCC